MNTKDLFKKFGVIIDNSDLETLEERRTNSEEDVKHGQWCYYIDPMINIIAGDITTAEMISRVIEPYCLILNDYSITIKTDNTIKRGIKNEV